MNSKSLSQAKNKLKKYLLDKDILDVILFGSAVKGKSLPADIDIALITEKEVRVHIPGFHISVLKPKDFFVKVPSIVHTLFREGYSLKNKKLFSELYKFSSKVLFKYDLVNLSPSIKVKVVNVLRGIRKSKGLVEENKGAWLANQVFTIPLEAEHIFEKFFLNFNVKFSKSYVLMH